MPRIELDPEAHLDQVVAKPGNSVGAKREKYKNTLFSPGIVPSGRCSIPKALTAPPLGLLDGELPLLLPQGDPHPQPTDHLDKHEGEKHPVLKVIAAPAGRVVRGGAV